MLRIKATFKASRRAVINAAIVLAILPFGVLAANAQTVKSIKKGGVLKVGAQVAQVPWGFTELQRKTHRVRHRGDGDAGERTRR